MSCAPDEVEDMPVPIEARLAQCARLQNLCVCKDEDAAVTVPLKWVLEAVVEINDLREALTR